ncbi:MAG: hypothetical protein U9R75_01605 [Candidatus Thermoplasmatota archaeon]|nr:hypothetical protein [Candidatus Thermoplasmatota archaeon]
MGGVNLEEISRLKEMGSSIKIGICTGDFSFLHNAVSILKERGIPHDLIVPDEPYMGILDCVILDRGMDTPDFPNCKPRIVRKTKDTEGTIDRAVFKAIVKGNPTLLVIGIDPGKRPGMAFLMDGQLVNIHRSFSEIDIIVRIKRARSSYRPGKLLVKIGDGDPSSRDMIIDELSRAGLSMELVDEHRTTTTRRFRDENAALKIARTRGKPI